MATKAFIGGTGFMMKFFYVMAEFIWFVPHRRNPDNPEHDNPSNPPP